MQWGWREVVPGASQLLQRFLPSLSTVVHPLNQLLENNHQWKWTAQWETAYHNMKEMITSKRVLTHYDLSLPLRLACDAPPHGNWCRAILCDEWWERATHCFCFQDTHKNWARVRTNWQRSPSNNLGSQEVPCVFVWPVFHLVHWSSAINIYLPSSQEHSSGYSSQASVLCIIPGWLWPQNRVQEH